MTAFAAPSDRRFRGADQLAGGAVLLALLAALSAGCRGGLGTTCRCAADCRAGLICRAEGEKPLSAELCYKPGVSGLCIESDDDDDDGAPVELTEAPEFLDMPSKRDFQPSGSISDSVTGTGTSTSTGTTDATTDGTTTTTTGTSTGTTTGTTTGTSTGTTTGTSTGTTTGTSTTSDTTTGTTGTTGGMTTGTTGTTGTT